MAEIYLVLCHEDANQFEDLARAGYFLAGRQVHHRHDRRVGVGGNGHDSLCHCLVVQRKTYRTREEADKAAEEMQTKDSSSIYWSLEVKEPE